MIRKISYVGIAVTLVVATAPSAWAENAAFVIEPKAAFPLTQADETAATPGWSLFGTCEWYIDQDKCLTIRPARNNSHGSLPSAPADGWPWRNDQSSIAGVRIEGSVICGESTQGLFSMSELVSIDLTGLDTSNVTDMTRMFWDSYKLEHLDLSSLDTSKVKRMAYMFDGCASLTSLDLSTWNTSNVTNMDAMFRSCSHLESLSINSFDTSNVTTMWEMFKNCGLHSLDLSHFRTSNVTDMTRMFNQCHSLKSINLANFDTRGVNKSSGLFSLYESLELVTIGQNFTLQDKFPDKVWYNAAGESFSRSTIPVGIAGTYATSPELLGPLQVTLSESVKAVSIEDEPFTLVATVTPAAKAEEPVWSSSDPDVASVDSAGTVTVHKVGTATITATVKDAHDSCLVTVNPLVVESTDNSSAEGQLTIEDVETAKALKGYSLLIRPSVHKGSANYEQRLLTDVAQQQRKAGTVADLLDVCLVDTVTGIEMDPSVAESLPPLDLCISLDNSLKALTAKNILSLWAVSDSGDAAKAASLEGNHFQALATIPGSYAIIATAKADSTGGNGSSSDDSSGSTPGNGSSSGDGNESSGSNNDDGSSKPGNDDDNQNSGDPSDKPDSENKPSTDGSATDDNNNDSNDNSSNGSNSNNSNNTANQGSTAGAGSSSNSSMNTVSESKADEKAGNTNLSSTKDSKNSSGNNKLSQTSDYTALNIVLIFILSISAAGAAVFSARKLRSLRRLR